MAFVNHVCLAKELLVSEIIEPNWQGRSAQICTAGDTHAVKGEKGVVEHTYIVLNSLLNTTHSEKNDTRRVRNKQGWAHKRILRPGALRRINGSPVRPYTLA